MPGLRGVQSLTRSSRGSAARANRHTVLRDRPSSSAIAAWLRPAAGSRPHQRAGGGSARRSRRCVPRPARPGPRGSLILAGWLLRAAAQDQAAHGNCARAKIQPPLTLARLADQGIRNSDCLLYLGRSPPSRSVPLANPLAAQGSVLILNPSRNARSTTILLIVVKQLLNVYSPHE
jgi:hypothetical protein